MFSNKQSMVAAALVALTPAYAHMIMSSPVPYGSPNNSPLAPDGSDFPCKIGGSGSYDVSTMNDWAVGSKQQLTFSGSATHGGGSCQVAVTTDKNPTKDTVWRVIHSIEGGCPTSGEGNGGALGVFDYTVPDSLPNGELTMAWTWFNRIGNREMYMNCAPVSVSGGASDTSAFDALPLMAVANIGGDSCTTTEGSDYTFGDAAGSSVVQAGVSPLVPLCGGASSPAPETPAAPPVDAPAPAPVPETPAPVPETPAPVPETPAPETPSFDTPVEAPVEAPAPVPEAPATPTPAPAPVAGGACVEGALICIGANQFGICAHGVAIPQPLAAGTSCSNGAIMKKRGYTHRHQRKHI